MFKLLGWAIGGGGGGESSTGSNANDRQRGVARPQKPQGDKKRKRKKKPKQKRAPHAYNIFMKEERANVRAKFPGLDMGDVNRKVAEAWAALDNGQQAVYRAKAEAVAAEMAAKVQLSKPNKVAKKVAAVAPPRPVHEPSQVEDEDDEDDEDSHLDTGAINAPETPIEKLQSPQEFMVLACPSERRSRAVRGEVDLHGVQKDLHLINSVLSKDYRVAQSANTVYTGKLQVHMALDHLEEYLNENPEDNKLVFYSGHGEDRHGDLVMHGGSLSYQQFKDKWLSSDAYQAGAHCLLVNDSCHSGKWVRSLEREDRQDLRLAIQASCSENETANDSPSFTETFMGLWSERKSTKGASRGAWRDAMKQMVYRPLGRPQRPCACVNGVPNADSYQWGQLQLVTWRYIIEKL